MKFNVLNKVRYLSYDKHNILLDEVMHSIPWELKI